MLLVYGCEPVLIKGVKNLLEAQKAAQMALKARALAQPGDTYILTAGIPFGATGATNTMIVETLA